MKPDQLASFLSFAGKNNFPVLVKGKPGIGKTSIIEQSAAAIGYDLQIAHPVISDPTDFKGLPYAQDGKASFLPYGDLETLINAERPLIYFLDDLGQAPPAAQAACMQLLLARKIGEHKVSKHVRFMAATNRKEDGAGVTGILEPVKSRFVSIVELDVDHKDWADWALMNNMPTELVGFIRFRPTLLDDAKLDKNMVNTVSPRTLSHVGKLQNAGLPEFLEFEVLSGAAGEGFAGEYRAFLKLWRELPDIDDVIRNPKTAKVPKQPDVHYALATALGARMEVDNIDNICEYLAKLPTELSVVTMLDAHKRNKEIAKTPAFVKWVHANEDVLK